MRTIENVAKGTKDHIGSAAEKDATPATNPFDTFTVVASGVVVGQYVADGTDWNLY